MPTVEYEDLTLDKAAALADDDETRDLLKQLDDRVAGIREEQDIFRQWCDRADGLYYVEDITEFGADLWPLDASQKAAGVAHISTNLPPVFVDVPASLQSVAPVENMLASDDTDAARAAAAAWERIYKAWQREEKFELKNHKAAVVKGLYGRTASFIYWDKDAENGKGRPCFTVVYQPRNLYLGWKDGNYEELEWAANVQLVDVSTVLERYGVDVQVRGEEREAGSVQYYVAPLDSNSQPSRPWLRNTPGRIEVWDYWYRLPKYSRGKFQRMETWNVVFAGNMAVRGPNAYPEYKGQIPYVPLLNTFIPGVPQGRPELYDMEQLIREYQERLTSGAQAISDATSGNYWQLVGPEAPKTAAGLKPRKNEVIAPGGGNRIEVIQPFIAQFQLEQYMARLDRTMSITSGLNDLLLGLSPSQVLNSSKAINALVANYEARLSMRRQLFYDWRKETWKLASKVYAAKNKDVKAVLDAGGGILDIIDPSLNPRDELETATKAANLMNAKLWSQARAMDAVGVDDPETEQDLIREESTDATLFPERTQVMAQLLAVLQSLGLQAPEGAQEQAQGQAGSASNDLRAALGAATPSNMAGGPGPGGDEAMMGQTPPIPGAAPEAGGPQPFIQGPAAGPGIAQTMLQGGEAKNRILSQVQLGRR